ncbi:GNAT family N-acetyltransferase [Altererythrobacter sp. B11]|uniref:GNAT family N-acetyltransferase n=1 Tax=Altererythrobacter sp. B11 TaxID=2060312 RepID=UPI000DC7065F|nr:GNAT family N-acetyltransferase [Altererythrobacter sp. B11]BBC71387.1 GNAT family N-acetyltransferase [Altererythrobacter sp. B11]
MIVFPTLYTERLEMTAPAQGDLHPLHDLLTEGDTARFLANLDGLRGQFDRLCRNAGSWVLYGYGIFMLRRPDEDGLIGTCGIFHSWRGLGADFDDSPEAGWIIGAPHVGQGLAGEAMRAALAWFEHTHGERRIVCMISCGNVPSLRLAAKLGFRRMREAQLPAGDSVILFERPPGGA